MREGWLAVVSVEYRFTDVAIHPAQVSDCLRAVQFVRQRAKEWNIDGARLGVTGGVAGAGDPGGVRRAIQFFRRHLGVAARAAAGAAGE